MKEKVWELLLKPVESGRILLRDANNENIGSGYEAVVVNLLRRTEPTDRLRAILSDSFSALPDSGEVCVIFGNKYSYQALLGRNCGYLNPVYSLSGIKNILKRSGFNCQKVYSLLPRGKNMFEIVSQNRHISLGRASLKDYMLYSPLMRLSLPAYAVVAGKPGASGDNYVENLAKAIGIKSGYKCIMGNPDTLVIVADDKIIRLPFDYLSRVRLRVSRITLKALGNTMLAGRVPRYLSGGNLLGQEYFCEERLSGIGIDEPVPRMDILVRKAAELITGFHKETRKNIILDERIYFRMFGRKISRLKPYLNEEYKEKLRHVEDRLRKQLMGKEFCAVWCHGDYKIENVLFDEKTWEISGVIDWDLSRRNGLPLLDIFYLLLYKDSLFSKKSIGQILRERALRMDFTAFERSVIYSYAAEIKIAEEFWQPLAVMFWVNHISHRYQQQLLREETAGSDWMREEVYNIIDTSLALRGRGR